MISITSLITFFYRFINKNTDLTKGNIPKQLLFFAIPFLLSNLMQILYNVSDTLIISRALGASAVSASNNGGQIINIVINVVSGLALGGTVLIGQLRGKKDEENLKKAVGTFLSLMVIIGFFLTIFFIFYAKNLLIFLNTDPLVLNDAVDFLKIYSYAIIFIFGYNSIVAISRGVGNSFTPFLFVLISVIVNIILDLLFVYTFSWGIRGAAYATTISIILSFIMSLIFLIKQTDIFVFKPETFKIHFKLAKKILFVGIPSGIQSSIFGLSILFITSFVNRYGITASATIGIGSKIDSMFLLPLIAIASASAAMIAQNLGAGEYERITKTIKATLFYNLIMAVIFFGAAQLFPTVFFKMFTNDNAIIEMGILYMRWASFNYLFIAFLQTYNSLAIGVGNTVFALCTTIMNGFVFRVPIAYVMENYFGLGIIGLFIGLGFANLGGSVAGYIYYKIGFWKKFKL